MSGGSSTSFCFSSCLSRSRSLSLLLPPQHLEPEFPIAAAASSSTGFVNLARQSVSQLVRPTIDRSIGRSMGQLAEQKLAACFAVTELHGAGVFPSQHGRQFRKKAVFFGPFYN